MQIFIQCYCMVLGLHHHIRSLYRFAFEQQYSAQILRIPAFRLFCHTFIQYVPGSYSTLFHRQGAAKKLRAHAAPTIEARSISQCHSQEKLSRITNTDNRRMRHCYIVVGFSALDPLPTSQLTVFSLFSTLVLHLGCLRTEKNNSKT